MSGTNQDAPLTSGAVGSTTGQLIPSAPSPTNGAPTTAPAPVTNGATTAPVTNGATAAPVTNGQAAGSPKLVLTQEQLNERLDRARRSALSSLFGDESPEKIKERLQRADALEKEAEDRRRAAMSAEERLKHDLARARQETLRARAEAATVREKQVVAEQQTHIERIASRHVAPQYVQDATFLFAKHLRDVVTPEQLDKLTDRDIAKWFQAFVARKPAFAASATTRTRVAAGAPTPVPRPRAPASESTNGAKSLRPGLQNSMTREEARAHMRKLGYTY